MHMQGQQTSCDVVCAEGFTYIILKLLNITFQDYFEEIINKNNHIWNQ